MINVVHYLDISIRIIIPIIILIVINTIIIISYIYTHDHV